MPNTETQRKLDALQDRRNALAVQVNDKAAEAARLRDQLTQLLTAGADDATRAPITARISALALEQQSLTNAIAQLDAQMVPLGQQHLRELAQDAHAHHEAAIAEARAARDALLRAVGIFARETMPPLIARFNRSNDALAQAAGASAHAAKSAQTAPGSAVRFIQLGENLGGGGANAIMDLLRVVDYWNRQLAPPNATTARASRVA